MSYTRSHASIARHINNPAQLLTRFKQLLGCRQTHSCSTVGGPRFKDLSHCLMLLSSSPADVISLQWRYHGNWQLGWHFGLFRAQPGLLC